MTLSVACPDQDRLRGLLDETLTSQGQAELEAHLESCESCQRRLESLVAGGNSWLATRRLAEGQPVETMSPALQQVVETLAGEGLPLEIHNAPGGIEADSLAFLGLPRLPGNLGRLDHYEVLEAAGQGGMGVVLKAFDERLHRIVAIKALAPHLATNVMARQRFVREARAAAAVAHEHVVAIHGVEDGSSVPYLVMQYVGGPSLQQRLDQGGPLELREIVRIGIQIASGLAAAHKQGLVHRDIKPANILLENGVERVKITDFGLARAADDASLTQNGVIAGTPQYMAPEQARGEAIDHRSDLFSLGSVLYALCTGRPPFRASTTLGVLKRVSEEPPRPIRDLNPHIPLWLCSLIGQLHAKDPRDRFQSAAEVADLLERHLAQLQVPGPAAPRVPIFPRRRLLIWTACAALLLAAGAVITYLAWPGPEKTGRTEASRLSTRSALTPDEWARLPSPLDGSRHDAIPATVRARVGGGDAAKAPQELIAVLGGNRFVMPNAGPTSWPAQSRDGKVLAVPCDSSVALFDGRTGVSLRHLTGHKGRVFRVAFSPKGKHLAVVSWDPEHTITVWDLAAHKPVLRLKGHTRTVVQVAYSPDGRLIASSSDDGTAKVWDAATGEEKLSAADHADHVWSVAFSPDGQRLLTGGKDGVLKVRTVATGKDLHTVKAHSEGISCLAFSSDGKLLATGNDHEGKLWDGRTFKVLHTLARPASWLAFLPDGRALLTGGHDHLDGTVHTVTRWNTQTGRESATMPLRSRGGFAVYHLSPDRATLFAMAANPADSRLNRYNPRTGREILPSPGHIGAVYSVAVHRDGRTIASGGADYSVRLWDAVSGKQVRAMTRHSAAIISVVFSPDGKLLASGSLDGTITLYSATGNWVRRLTGHSCTHSLIAFSPDGRTLAAGGADGLVHFWDVPTGAQQPPRQFLPQEAGAVRAVAFSPDGKTLAAGGQNGTIKVGDLATCRLHLLCHFPVAITDLKFSPNGERLAAVCDAPDAALRIWTLATGQEETRRGHSGHSTTLAFHPGGHLVATGSLDGTLRLWETAANRGRVRTIGPGPFGLAVEQVAFTPEGRYLVTANTNGMVFVFRIGAFS
jgi:WD40 repeat protein/serine/threonine protein kinase